MLQEGEGQDLQIENDVTQVSKTHLSFFLLLIISMEAPIIANIAAETATINQMFPP